MRIFILGIYSVLMAMFTIFNGGCYEHPRVAQVGVGVHDDQSRHDHDNDHIPIDDADNDQDHIDR
jgi:hypothetical protein